MTIHFADIDAVTFDFYNTLVYHRQGSGRGAMLMEYFRSQELESNPWEHQVLYDVFEQHARDYSPHLPAEEKRRYLMCLTHRVFKRLNVRAPDGAAPHHAANVWSVLGPSSLGVFPDVLRVLEILRREGYRVAVVSNWQCGLQHFCTELGFGDALDHVVASAEVGCAKPDPEIFRDVCRRMGIPCHRVLHVGDSVVDDVEGARGAGMHAVLVRRDDRVPAAGTVIIPSLDRLPDMLGLNGAVSNRRTQ
jgi:HAD superfamily hydrolase (TIGR01662 family)